MIGELKSRPVLSPGDMFEVVGAEFPPKSGKVKEWLGLYGDFGFPNTAKLRQFKDVSQEMYAVLNERIVGRAMNSERGICISVIRYPPDGRWYYLLSLDGCKMVGWTRASIRLRKVT